MIKVQDTDPAGQNSPDPDPYPWFWLIQVETRTNYPYAAHMYRNTTNKRKKAEITKKK